MTAALSDIQSLARSVNGQVMTPADPGFEEELSPFNQVACHEPEILVAVEDADDVAAAVRWAADHRMPVAVQATGHGAIVSYDRGMLISTKHMQSLTLDPVARTVRVGAGVRWRQVIEAAEPHGLVPLNGSSSDVGAVGYTLGGGLPILGRTFGFASSYLRAADIVTADGQLHRVSAQNDPDVFFALRGGKPSVGIVTSMTIGLVPLPAFYGGCAFFDGDHADRLFHAFRDWTAALPDTTTTAIRLLRLPPLPEVPEPLRERLTVQLIVAHAGNAATGASLIAPMRALAPAIFDDIRERPYREADQVYRDPEQPIPTKETSALLSELTPEAIDAIMTVAGPGVRTPLLLAELRHLGGMLARTADPPDAAGARDAAYSLFMLGILTPATAETLPGALAEAAATMAPFATGHSFVNLTGPPASAAEAARSWPAEIYDQLLRTKQAYDPSDRFQFAQSEVGSNGG